MFSLPLKMGHEAVLRGREKDAQHQGRERGGDGEGGLENISLVILISPWPLLGGEQLGHLASGASSSHEIPQWFLLERAIFLLDLPTIFLFFVALDLFWNVLKRERRF